jgi:hypothetical protein
MDRRIRNIGDARIEIAHEAASPVSARSATAGSRRRPIVQVVGFGLALVLVAVGVLLTRSEKGHPGTQPASFKQVTFVRDAGGPVVSPDGQFLAYVTGPLGDQKAIMQDLIGGGTIEVFRTQRIADVEWSPDGSNILVSSSAGLDIFSRLRREDDRLRFE